MPIYTGKTIAIAKQAAATALGVPTDQLTIKVIQEPRNGFLGIGRRAAKISAEPVVKNKPAAKPTPDQPATTSAPASAHSTTAPRFATSQPTAAPTDVKDGDELDPAVIKAHHAANISKVRMRATSWWNTCRESSRTWVLRRHQRSLKWRPTRSRLMLRRRRLAGSSVAMASGLTPSNS